jgi:hypothetical protein
MTSVVLNSGHVVLVNQWMAEIVGGTEVEEWRKEDAVCRPSQQPEYSKI